MTYKKVQLIEQSPFSLSGKVELLLVYANQKPATDLSLISYDHFNSETQTFEVPPRIIEKTRHFFEKLNVPFIQGEGGDFEGWSYYGGRPTLTRVIPWYVGRDEELRDDLIATIDSCDSYKMGRLFGYPETAIQAFHGDRPPFMGNLDDGSPYDFFARFVFSQEYFREEFESTTVRWHDTVRKLSPKLYGTIAEYCAQAIEHTRNFRISWR